MRAILNFTLKDLTLTTLIDDLCFISTTEIQQIYIFLLKTKNPLLSTCTLLALSTASSVFKDTSDSRSDCT